MEITKFAHACLAVTVDDQTLVIDPGAFTDNFVMPETVTAIVVTHQHPDHQDPELISSIVRQFPDVAIYTTDDTVLSIESDNITIVAPGQQEAIGPFSLAFFGGEHARIDQSIAPIHNIGVMVNDLLYYGGDSFALPDRPVTILALPVAAPWLKIAEALDYLREIRPKQAFPTHDAILSQSGKTIVDRLAGGVAENIGTNYERLQEASTVRVLSAD